MPPGGTSPVSHTDGDHTDQARNSLLSSGTNALLNGRGLCSQHRRGSGGGPPGGVWGLHPHSDQSDREVAAASNRLPLVGQVGLEPTT